MKRLLLSTLLMATLLVSIGTAQESDSVIINRAKFVFDDPTGRNIVMFTSDAPLETIIGKTSALYGYIDINLDSLSDSPDIFFECDLTKLKTGIAEWDTDMLSDEYLATDSFPNATFKLLKIKRTSEEKMVNEAEVNLVVRGEFTLRGVIDTLNVTVAATYFTGNKITATRLPGDIIKFKAEFDFRMSDYGIKIPETAFLKLEDRIHVEVDAFGGTEVEPIDRSLPTEEPIEQITGEQVIDSTGK